MQVLVSNLPIGLASVDCNGSETSLLQCSTSDDKIRECGVRGTDLSDALVLACADLTGSTFPFDAMPHMLKEDCALARLFACPH